MTLHDRTDVTPVVRPPMDALKPSLPSGRSYLSALRGVKSVALDLQWDEAAAEATAATPLSAQTKETTAEAPATIGCDEWIMVEPMDEDSDDARDYSSSSSMSSPVTVSVAAAQMGDESHVLDVDEYSYDDDEYEYSYDEFDSLADHDMSQRLMARVYSQSWSRCSRHTYHMRYFLPGSQSAVRLQVASSNACRSMDDGTRTTSAPPSPPPPISTPYNQPQVVRAEGAKRPTPPPREAPLRDNKKSDGAHRLARASVQRSRGALDAATRPAMAHAGSNAHRVVLVARAQRKVEVRREVAARALSTPRHLRKTSFASHPPPRSGRSSVAQQAAANRLRSPLARRSSDSTVHVSRETGFVNFRDRFYAKYQDRIESALDGAGSVRVAAVRLCPVDSSVQQRFMRKMRELHSADSDVPLVFHGTALDNMDSICQRGLLVPGTGGIQVMNGSALGVGIYSAHHASTSLGYARGTSTMFVCAALTKGDGVVQSRGVVVLAESTRICPLFLLDFDPVQYGRRWTGDAPAMYMRAAHARALLRRLHSMKRDRCASRTATSHAVLQVDSAVTTTLATPSQAA